MFDRFELIGVLRQMNNTMLQEFFRLLSKCKSSSSVPPYLLTDFFEHFVLNNQIGYIGGVNSKNFEIKPLDGNAPYVLKLVEFSLTENLDYRMQAHPTLRHILAEVYYKRDVIFDDVKYQFHVLPRFRGNLWMFSNNEMTQDERLKNALDIYTQVAEAYEAFRCQGILFADGKNENYLLNEGNALSITDTKWCLDAPDGLYRDSLHAFNHYYMGIPENPPYSIDKIHALHLGKNLYQYLTSCRWEYLADPTNANAPDYKKGCDAQYYSFSVAIFQTPVGAKLKDIIVNAVKLEPHARCSVVDIRTQLRALNHNTTVFSPQFFKAQTVLKLDDEHSDNSLSLK